MNANGTRTHAKEAPGSGRLSAAALGGVSQPAPDAEAPLTLAMRARAAMLEDGKSQSEAAREIDCGVAVLNQWLQGRYAGDNATVDRKVAKWLAARGERVEIASLIPESPQFFESTTALRIIDHLRVTQMMRDMLAVFGVPGTGKSKALRQYQRAYPNVWIATMSSSVTTVVPVLQEICTAVRGASKGTGAAPRIAAITERVMNTNGLLVIDEAHHVGKHALDSIRAIHDATGIAIAIVGGVELESRIQSMPQFDSRVGLKLFVTAVLKADVAAQLDAWRITKRDERAFVTRVSQGPGGLRRVDKVLRLASMHAAGAGVPLGLAQIKDAAETLAAQVTGEDA